MKRTIRTFISAVGIMFCACSQNPVADSTDFVFCTENVEGDETDYSKPAVITGILPILTILLCAAIVYASYTLFMNTHVQ